MSDFLLSLLITVVAIIAGPFVVIGGFHVAGFILHVFYRVFNGGGGA